MLLLPTPVRQTAHNNVRYNKYNILERVIVEKIIPQNMIINRGAALVDNHIPRDDIFDYHPLKNVIFI